MPALPPSTPHTLGAHQRALPRLQNETTPPPETTPLSHERKPTEQQAELVLKLLLANLDHGDVRTIALKLLPEYTKFCSTPIDCEELRTAMRRLYIARYSELQLAFQRMDKLGLLMRRMQYMTEKGAIDAGHSRSGLHRRRPGHQHPKLHRIWPHDNVAQSE
jgi:hypothetical protein